MRIQVAKDEKKKLDKQLTKEILDEEKDLELLAHRKLQEEENIKTIKQIEKQRNIKF